MLVEENNSLVDVVTKPDVYNYNKGEYGIIVAACVVFWLETTMAHNSGEPYSKREEREAFTPEIPYPNSSFP